MPTAEEPPVYLPENVETAAGSGIFPPTEEKTPRHYNAEEYAPYIDNPFAGKHQPQPHYTRYEYPYDPHGYYPDEHYPVHHVKKRKRSADPFDIPQVLTPAVQTYPDTNFDLKFNNPAAYMQPHHDPEPYKTRNNHGHSSYPDHNFPLQYNSPNAYGDGSHFPDHHFEPQYNHPDIYKQDPHTKIKRYSAFENRKVTNGHYGRISQGGSKHFLSPLHNDYRQKRDVLDDKQYTNKTYSPFADNPYAKEHQPDPEYNA